MAPSRLLIQTILIGLLTLLLTAVAKAQSSNQVLHFRGSENFAEIPHTDIASLRAATIEGWVRWSKLRESSRFVEFGTRDRCLTLALRGPRPDLVYEIRQNRTEPQAGRRRAGAIHVAGIVPLDQWCHIAAVSGPSGMRLYFNGMLVGSNDFQGSLANLGIRSPGYLGQSVWLTGDHLAFDGQMDDFRIWAEERTQAQIQQGMLQPPTNRHPTLLVCLDFERDLRDPRLGRVGIAQSRGVEVRVPSLPRPTSPPPLPAIIRGTLRTLDGDLLNRAIVQVLDLNGVLVEGRTGGLAVSLV
ncbi:MAG: LamG domain-containing protein, partial [Verrucomicrobia bacterium]|nr:LamG domain-containing protein [Verrucomicrobiota bacterium]